MSDGAIVMRGQEPVKLIHALQVKSLDIGGEEVDVVKGFHTLDTCMTGEI